MTFTGGLVWWVWHKHESAIHRKWHSRFPTHYDIEQYASIPDSHDSWTEPYTTFHSIWTVSRTSQQRLDMEQNKYLSRTRNVALLTFRNPFWRLEPHTYHWYRDRKQAIRIPRHTYDCIHPTHPTNRRFHTFPVRVLHTLSIHMVVETHVYHDGTIHLFELMMDMWSRTGVISIMGIMGLRLLLCLLLPGLPQAKVEELTDSKQTFNSSSWKEICFWSIHKSKKF